MARSLGASKVLVFGPSDVRIPAKFTAVALLKPLFRQFQKLDFSHLEPKGVGYILVTDLG